MVNYTGQVSFCCYLPWFANINIKNLSGDAVAEIWNGKVAQDLRRRWNENRLNGTPCGSCVGLRRFKKYEHPAKDVRDENHDALFNARLNFSEFQQGKTILSSMPVSIVYIPSVLCNLACIHCFQPPIGKHNESYLESKVLLNFYHALGGKAIVNLFSGGEPFYLRQTIDLLNEFNPDQRAVSKAIIQTNGLLIKEKFQLFQGFKKYHFTISIPSFRKETCEYIQRGTTFEKLTENLEFLVKCKSEGMDISTTLHMILMKSNFIDLENIFDFAETCKFDEIWVTPTMEPSGKNTFLPGENIFQYPNLLKEIPGWKNILTKASERAFTSGYKVTYDHLEYIAALLFTASNSNDKGIVLLNTLCKDLKSVAVYYLPTPIKSLIRKALLRGLTKDAR